MNLAYNIVLLLAMYFTLKSAFKDMGDIVAYVTMMCLFVVFTTLLGFRLYAGHIY